MAIDDLPINSLSTMVISAIIGNIKLPEANCYALVCSGIAMASEWLDTFALSDHDYVLHMYK